MYPEIKVSYETMMELPQEVKEALIVFDLWFISQKNPKRNEMPPEVSAAYEKINEAEIPDGSGTKYRNSCFMKEIELKLCS